MLIEIHTIETTVDEAGQPGSRFDVVATLAGAAVESQPRLAMALVPKAGRQPRHVARWAAPLTGVTLRVEVEDDFFDPSYRAASSAFLMQTLQQALPGVRRRQAASRGPGAQAADRDESS